MSRSVQLLLCLAVLLPAATAHAGDDRMCHVVVGGQELVAEVASQISAQCQHDDVLQLMFAAEQSNVGTIMTAMFCRFDRQIVQAPFRGMLAVVCVTRGTPRPW